MNPGGFNKEKMCAHCGELNYPSNPHPLKKCAGCQKVFYCSISCQKADWLNHKSACQASKKNTSSPPDNPLSYSRAPSPERAPTPPPSESSSASSSSGSASAGPSSPPSSPLSAARGLCSCCEGTDWPLIFYEEKMEFYCRLCLDFFKMKENLPLILQDERIFPRGPYTKSKATKPKVKSLRQEYETILSFILSLGRATPLTFSPDKVVKFYSHCISTSNPSKSPLLTACLGAHVGFVKALLKEGANRHLKVYRDEVTNEWGGLIPFIDSYITGFMIPGQGVGEDCLSDLREIKILVSEPQKCAHVACQKLEAQLCPCEEIAYCSKECQNADWKQHGTSCTARIKRPAKKS
jgi:hypothetical protein